MSQGGRALDFTRASTRGRCVRALWAWLSGIVQAGPVLQAERSDVFLHPKLLSSAGTGRYPCPLPACASFLRSSSFLGWDPHLETVTELQRVEIEILARGTNNPRVNHRTSTTCSDFGLTSYVLHWWCQLTWYREPLPLMGDRALRGCAETDGCAPCA